MVLSFGQSRSLWALAGAATFLVACDASKTLRLLPDSNDDEGAPPPGGSAGSSGSSQPDAADAGSGGVQAHERRLSVEGAIKQ